MLSQAEREAGERLFYLSHSAFCVSDRRMLADRLRAFLGRRLEAGSSTGVARAASEAWAAASARAVARSLTLPEAVRVIGVGGAVLGGAGKTPLSIAIARALADRGDRVALVGHGYRARPGRARVVRPGDRVGDVGDDALAAARALAPSGVVVVVAPRRQAAIDHAASLGHGVLVVDGLLQSAPARLSAALLTLDALAPWGAGACPPAGDLRAPPEALLGACDHVAVIVPEGAVMEDELAGLGAIAVPSRVAGAISASGERVTLSSLASMRLGLLVGVARPSRIAKALERAGVTLHASIALGDHAAFGPRDLARAAHHRVDAWLTTARCATKLPAGVGATPLLSIEQHLSVEALMERLAGPGAGG